jgi:hypothetical protein
VRLRRVCALTRQAWHDWALSRGPWRPNRGDRRLPTERIYRLRFDTLVGETSPFHSQLGAVDQQERTANIASCFTSGAPLTWLNVGETFAPSETFKYPRLPSLEHPLTNLLITDASPAGHVPLASTGVSSIL